jgi:nitric oxide reductase subunit C
MTKRQSRLFFLVSTACFSLVFLALTLHSHTRFGELTNADKMDAQVIAGKDVWHSNNCINCHTLLGEGAYYAPDLTKITQQRGEAYLAAFLSNPSKFYSEQRHRRIMPDPELSETEIDDVIAFLDWVSQIDNQGWPPRPILVSGATFPGTNTNKATGAASSGDAPPAAAAAGEQLFSDAATGCSGCHSIAPGVDLAGPSLAGVGERARRTVTDDGYTGSADTAAGYLRESIVAPSAHLVGGDRFSANGTSFMPTNYGTDLDADQIDALVDYLSTLK